MYQGLYIWVYVNKVLKIIKKEKNTPNSLTKIQWSKVWSIKNSNMHVHILKLLSKCAHDWIGVT